MTEHRKIDEARYLGRTPTSKWQEIVWADGLKAIYLDDDTPASDTDRQLMADAPLFLDKLEALHGLICLLDEMLDHDTMTFHAREELGEPRELWDSLFYESKLSD